MLGYYAARFPVVEINNTFYRMPKESVLLDWASKVPPSFRFAIKAIAADHPPRQAQGRGERGRVPHPHHQCAGRPPGATLFQLPPNLKKDLPRLVDFLEVLPRGWRSTFEFRHSSWFDDDVYDALRAKDAAMCIADHDDFETRRCAPRAGVTPGSTG
jgi:uncharacterized protein YecE (DUF72 family)